MRKLLTPPPPLDDFWYRWSAAQLAPRTGIPTGTRLGDFVERTHGMPDSGLDFVTHGGTFRIANNLAAGLSTFDPNGNGRTLVTDRAVDGPIRVEIQARSTVGAPTGAPTEINLNYGAQHEVLPVRATSDQELVTVSHVFRSGHGHISIDPWPWPASATTFPARLTIHSIEITPLTGNQISVEFATVHSGTGPTRVDFRITDQPSGANITIERSLDRHKWVPVRGATNLMMPDGELRAEDWTVPLGRRVYYRLLVNGTSMGEAWVETQSDGVSWLQDAYAPHLGVPISVSRLDTTHDMYGTAAFRQATWPQAISEAQVLGASLPVESVAIRSRVGRVPIEIHALIPGNDERLRELLLTAGPLLLRGAPCDIADGLASAGLFAESQYIVIPEITETHPGNPHEIATFTGIARYTQEPPTVAAAAHWSWGDVIARVRDTLGPNVTWGQVQAATLPTTWGQVGQNPTLWGATG